MDFKGAWSRSGAQARIRGEDCQAVASRRLGACGRLRASVARAGFPAALAVLTGGCHLPAPEAQPPLLLVERGASQSISDSQGHRLRVLLDADGDRRADTQVLYRPDGTLLAAEVDADRDGVVDRWERYAPDGTLERVGRSLRSRARPDVWEYPDGAGGWARREFDDDGDGIADRVERRASDEPGVLLEELDTDGDGKPDRRLRRTTEGILVAIEIDRDEDGVWERRETVRPR